MPNTLETHETAQEHPWQADDREVLTVPTVRRRVQVVRDALGAWWASRRQRLLEQTFARTQAPETGLDALARKYPDIYLAVWGR